MYQSYKLICYSECTGGVELIDALFVLLEVVSWSLRFGKAKSIDHRVDIQLGETRFSRSSPAQSAPELQTNLIF